MFNRIIGYFISIYSDENGSITCYRITIYHFCHTTNGYARIVCFRSIELLNRSFGEQNLFATIGSNGSCQGLKTNLECTGPQLSIERVTCQLIGQLFCIQQGILLRVFFGFHLFLLGFTCTQKPCGNLWQGRFRSIQWLGITTHTTATFDLTRMFSSICRIRAPDVEIDIRKGVAFTIRIDIGSPCIRNQGTIVFEVFYP